MEIVSAGSSSSGNSYIIIAGENTIILDVGLPAKKIKGALEHLGCDPEDVGAVLITHEHVDHVKSVRAISRCCVNARFYASRGTVENAQNFCHVPEERVNIISAGDTAEMDGVVISAFPLSHDAAEPIGFTVAAGGEKLAVVTDSGIISEEIYDAIRDADQLVFEANHDVDMLMVGEYPYPVKVRIKGDKGHLSNDCAGDVLARILEYRKSGRGDRPPGQNRPSGQGVCPPGQRPLRIMLAHLSFHNNMPLFAKQTVETALHDRGFHRGTDYVLDVAAKEGLTFMPGDSDA